MISLDGCRWDYPEWHDMPFMDYMAENGVKSGLIPSFPSKTFPNHYTLVTGLYPDHHGIVANTFLDISTGETFSLSKPEQKMNPLYYGGEPIWLTAKRQGLRTSVFYWPGSDVAINGDRPSLFYYYDQKPRLTLKERMDGIVDQLTLPDDERPDLILAYMEQPDANGHNFGPQSKQTRSAIHEVDSLLNDLYLRIKQLPIGNKVNLIVVSDHGMAWVDTPCNISIADKLKTDWIIDSQGNIPENIYVKEGYADSVYNALKDLPHARVWRKKDVPSYLHYGSCSRIGDIIVLPDIGYIVYDDELSQGSGQHGYDPTLSDMQAVFRAVGPDFEHIALPHFPNVNVYGLLCRLLDIQPAPYDGSIDEIKAIFKQ